MLSEVLILVFARESGLTTEAIRRKIEDGVWLQWCEYRRGPSADEGLAEDELKRLDKATTVMKVAFNIVKKVLSAPGVGGRFNPSEKVDA